jgi:hypothetical protein
VTLVPLEVRGNRLLAREVPVYQDDRIIGAVGIALFTDMASLAVLAVLLLREAVAWEVGRDFLEFGAALALVVGALTFFLSRK